MTRNILIAFTVAALLSGCGLKRNLELPGGKHATSQRTDDSTTTPPATPAAPMQTTTPASPPAPATTPAPVPAPAPTTPAQP